MLRVIGAASDRESASAHDGLDTAESPPCNTQSRQQAGQLPKSCAASTIFGKSGGNCSLLWHLCHLSQEVRRPCTRQRMDESGLSRSDISLPRCNPQRINVRECLFYQQRVNTLTPALRSANFFQYFRSAATRFFPSRFFRPEFAAWCFDPAELQSRIAPKIVVLDARQPCDQSFSGIKLSADGVPGSSFLRSNLHVIIFSTRAALLPVILSRRRGERMIGISITEF